MVRTQVQLDEEQADRLKQLARSEGVSMAELVRRSVNMMLAGKRTCHDADVRARAIAAVGKLRSGTGDLSRRHDDYAAEAFTE